MSTPNDAVWYIMRDGQRFGPFNADAFARFEQEGQFSPTDGIWRSGTDTWIAYSDYEARKAAARLVAPEREGISTKADDKQRVLCRWARTGIRALARAPATAFRTISSNRATKNAASPGVDASPAADASAPERAVRRTATPSAGAHPEPIPSALPLSQEPDFSPLSNGPVRERPAGRATRRDSNQGQSDCIPAVLTQDVAGPSLYVPSIPRLANEGQAASHIGLELTTFRAWVSDGRLPHALRNSDKYDLKAIHLALDHMSGIASENTSNDWIERLAKSQAVGTERSQRGK